MKWIDIKTFLISFFIPLAVVLIPMWKKLINRFAITKKLKAQVKIAEDKLSIDSFNSILEESKALREEFKNERNFFKNELEKKEAIANELSNSVIEITTRYQQSERQVKTLIEVLKRSFGMSE